jgi:hypothetical protein
MEAPQHVCMYVAKTCYRIQVGLNNSQFTLYFQNVIDIYWLIVHVMCVIINFCFSAFLNDEFPSWVGCICYVCHLIQSFKFILAFFLTMVALVMWWKQMFLTLLTIILYHPSFLCFLSTFEVKELQLFWWELLKLFQLHSLQTINVFSLRDM